MFHVSKRGAISIKDGIERVKGVEPTGRVSPYETLLPEFPRFRVFSYIICE